MIEINLLPKEYRKKTFDFSIGKTGVYVIAGAAAVVLMLIGITFYQIHQLNSLESNIAKAQQRAAMLQKDIKLVDGLLDVKDKISRRMNAVERLDRHRSSWVRLLEDMSRNVPDFVWLHRFTEIGVQAPVEQKEDNKSKNKKDKNKNEKPAKPEPPQEKPNYTNVEIEGYSFTLNALATFMINMMRSEYFEDVELILTDEKILDEHKAYNFIVTCSAHFISDDEMRKLVAQANDENKSESVNTEHRVLN